MNWSMFATLSVFAATIHWIIARSSAMSWFWDAKWLPRIVNALLECAACSGFWLGLALGAIGLQPIPTGNTFLNIFVAGTLTVFGTPIAESIMLWGLDRTRI